MSIFKSTLPLLVVSNVGIYSVVISSQALIVTEMVIFVCVKLSIIFQVQ